MKSSYNRKPKANRPQRRSPFSSHFLRLMSHLSLLTILFVLPAFSQKRWERHYGGTGDDEGWSVQQTQDSGYIVVGNTTSFGAGGSDIYLIKTDPMGNCLWSKTYGDTGYESGLDVQQTSDGGYIVVGVTCSNFADSGSIYLVKTNSQGDTLWSKTYGGSGYEWGKSVQQTPDDGYIMAGTTSSFGAADYDVCLIKTDSLGNALWVKTYGSPGYDEGWCVQQTRDSGYIVCGGQDFYGPKTGDVFLFKTNSQGDTLWTKTYGDSSYDMGYFIQQTRDGGYILVGNHQHGIYLIKTDLKGDSLWSRTFGFGDYDQGYCVRQTSDGGYIIVGGIYPFGSGYDDVHLIKTNNQGDTLWTRTFGGIYHDEGSSVSETKDYGYIIAGNSSLYPSQNWEVYLIKTDSNGNVGLEEKAPSHPMLFTSRLAVSPNPFVSFTSVPGHASERFALYDISGRKMGVYKGDRIGEGLSAGVYFLRPEGKDSKPMRVVKVR